jgi:hypothetical protein
VGLPLPVPHHALRVSNRPIHTPSLAHRRPTMAILSSLPGGAAPPRRVTRGTESCPLMRIVKLGCGQCVNA